MRAADSAETALVDPHHAEHGKTCGENSEIHVGGLACCGHDKTEDGLKARLLLVCTGAVLLLLSQVLRIWQAESSLIPGAFAMLGAAIAALPTVVDTLRGLWGRSRDDTEFYMNQFITLAVLACFATGQHLTAGVVAIILVVGHILEDRSMLGANAAIQSLLKLTHVRARVLRNGIEEMIDAEALVIGDVLRIRPGDTLPADGIVRSGRSTINQSTITGESLPVDVQAGSQVFAGTSNLSGLIEVEATATGNHTVLGRVKDIVEEAQRTRSPLLRLTEEYARHYTPLILIIAGLVLFFTRDVQRAISVIVVSIPCAFVLAGPSAMVAALAAASRLGVLLKSARFFEAATKVDTVVFDKTGTLTMGELRVAEIRTFNGTGENELLALAAAAERHSTHPVARAVTAAARERKLAIAEATDVEEMHGLGVQGIVDGRRVIVGRSSLLAESGWNVGEFDYAENGLSILYVGVDGEVLGAIGLNDVVRPETQAVGGHLRRLGIGRIVMLTGDRPGAAAPVAAALGAEEFEAGCLPEHKRDKVQALKDDGHVVMVVGDGVNDAPAMAVGDLGVAMGALGSDVAIQTADIALMTNDLDRIPQFLALSRRTLRIINQNMLGGLLFITASIALSSLGLVTPIAAAFIHEAGAFLVIFNSARLLRFDGTAA